MRKTLTALRPLLTPTRVFLFIISGIVLSQPSCTSDTRANVALPAAAALAEPGPVKASAADAATILARKQVPVLCYHQIRDWKATDSKTAKAYIVPENIFNDQIKSLADSGYQSITTGQLYEYLVYGKELPEKPVLITFDDSRVDHYTIAKPVLEKYGFRGAFYIMTVALGKPGYMSREQVKALADAGHDIGSHTYDHKNVKTYVEKDWEEQVAKPSRQLEAITGKPVEYFAYPFGLWNRQAIPQLKRNQFRAAFQLSTERDTDDPLYTIRRIIVTGDRGGAGMQRLMKASF